MKNLQPSKPNFKISSGVSLVIPVYNNAATLKEHLQKSIEALEKICKTYEIIISNDKSTDNTESVLKQYSNNKNIIICNQKKNLGIAKNILFLYKKAKYEYIVLFSLDGDWEPNDITRLILHAVEQKADIVIGKRNVNDFPFARKIVSVIYNLLPLILFGVKTHDTGSIKIIKKEIIDTTELKSQSVSFESELLIKAVKKGYKLSTIPISYKKQKINKRSTVNSKLISESFIDLLRLRIQE